MTQNNSSEEMSPALKSAAAKLFDIRIMIGGLFVVYGLMLTIAGFFTTAAELAKAANININLWLGLGMLVLGVFFLVWARLDPQHPDPNPTGVTDADAPRPRPTH